MERANGLPSISYEVDALVRRFELRRLAASGLAPAQAKPPVVIHPSALKPSASPAAHNAPDPSKAERPSLPPAPTPQLRVGENARFVPWRVREFKEVYAPSKEKPVILKHEHAEKIDAIRRDYNRRRMHKSREPMTTSDVINAFLDFIFSHPGIPFDAVEDKEALAQTVCDHVHATARRHRYAIDE